MLTLNHDENSSLLLELLLLLAIFTLPLSRLEALFLVCSLNSSQYVWHPPVKKATRVSIEFGVELIRQVDPASLGRAQPPGFHLAMSSRVLPQLRVESYPEAPLEHPGTVVQSLGEAEERQSTQIGDGAAEEQAATHGRRQG